jgi:hypothetical protein
MHIAMQWRNISQTIFSLTISWRFPSLHCIASIYQLLLHSLPLELEVLFFIFTVCSYQQNFLISTVDFSSFNLIAKIYNILGNTVLRKQARVLNETKLWFVISQNYCYFNFKNNVWNLWLYLYLNFVEIWKCGFQITILPNQKIEFKWLINKFLLIRIILENLSLSLSFYGNNS